jgi:hypothetical protein
MAETTELNKRLLAVGETVKAKGWPTASINIYVQYLGIFDREPGPLDPMISYRPSITASTRDKYGSPASHEFVRGDGCWDAKTLEQAVGKLQEAADAMPTMAAETDRIEQARAKLSGEERRLLGVR